MSKVQIKLRGRGEEMSGVSHTRAVDPEREVAGQMIGEDDKLWLF